MFLQLALWWMEKSVGMICTQNISLKSLLSSREDLLASLIGFLEIRLIFRKHPIPSSQEGSGGLRPY